MKLTKYTITLVIIITLSFSLNKTALNSSANQKVNFNNNGLTTNEQQIKKFPGGVNITFDDLASQADIDNHYPGVEFSPGYKAWNSSPSPTYPPESGENVAYTYEINNWFVFDMPIEKIGFFISTGPGNYSFVVTAYTNQSVSIEEKSLEDHVANQYVEFNSPLGRIYNISVSGDTDFNNWWAIDSISYLKFISPTPNIIDFEDLNSGESVTGKYAGISFEVGYTAWDSTSSPKYPPHSGNIIVYTYDPTPFIIFSFEVEFVSFYINIGDTYNMQFSAYSESGSLLDREYVSGEILNHYVTLESTYGKIQNITITGNSGFNTYWTMDDLCYREHESLNAQLITGDDLANRTRLGDLYENVTFSEYYVTNNASESPIYPPQSGDFNFYSQETDNYIIFTNPVSYVSFYICQYLDHNDKVKVFNSDDVLVKTVDVEANAINQFVEITSTVGLIHRIWITGDTGYPLLWAIDTLYFEEYRETFEFTLDFENVPSNNLSIYPHINFSTGYQTWISSGSVYYPPVSGIHVAFNHNLNPNVTFEIPIIFASFYISTSPDDYNLEVLAYNSKDELIFRVGVEPDSRSKFIEIYSEDSNIYRIMINGTTGYESYWTLENLYYKADIFTYDLDEDGLSYYEEMIYNTDPFNWDSDGDGFSDGVEVAEGTDPNDPFDYPIVVPEYRTIALIVIIPFLVSFGLYLKRKK